MNELADEKRRNNRDIRQVQEEILKLRIDIKTKEDNLRDLKAKICFMYSKLHNQPSPRTNSKSKDRNMSISVRKFNNKEFSQIPLKEAYIGNNAFKCFSR